MNRILGILLLATLLSAGCAYRSLPRGARPVGGGLVIQWEAPTKGTVILREEVSGVMVASESLGEGEIFNFPRGIEDTEALQRLFGDTGPLAARFVLYFVQTAQR